MGGAPEFVIPNGPIPTGAKVGYVGNPIKGIGAAMNLGNQLSGASGGYVLYPSKPNNNMMNAVYYK